MKLHVFPFPLPLVLKLCRNENPMEEIYDFAGRNHRGGSNGDSGGGTGD
jgi:hypothetical protein